MLDEGHTGHNEGLELPDQVGGALLKIALADSVKTYSCKWCEPHVCDVFSPTVCQGFGAELTNPNR